MNECFGKRLFVAVCQKTSLAYEERSLRRSPKLTIASLTLRAPHNKAIAYIKSLSLPAMLKTKLKLQNANPN